MRLLVTFWIVHFTLSNLSFPPTPCWWCAGWSMADRICNKRSTAFLQLLPVEYQTPFKVPLWSKKSLPFFLEILKVCLLNTWLAKFWHFIFIQRQFTLSVSFGFHDPPLLTFKPDRFDLRGLDPGKVTSKAHQLKISACERSLLCMQSASLKVWKPKTPVLHINSAAYTRIAFLN